MVTTVFDRTTSLTGTTGGNFANTNFRVVIGSSLLGVATGTQIRITLRWGTDCATLAAGCTNMWVGRAAASGHAYDFNGNQVQVLFGAGAAPSCSASGQVVSDWITFGGGETYDNTKPLVIAFWTVNTITTSTVSEFSPLTGVDEYSEGTSGGSTSATSVVTLSLLGNGFLDLIEKIEIQAAGNVAPVVAWTTSKINTPGQGPSRGLRQLRAFPIIGGQDTPMAAACGFYVLTGQAAPLGIGMPAVTGTYTLTGEALVFGTGLTSAFGSYTLTGEAAPLDIGMPASFGAYALTGQAVTFVTGSFMTAACGFYTLTGEPATNTTGMPATFGSYTLSGQATPFDVGMPAVSGSYSLIGETATFDGGLTAGFGSYLLSGPDVTFTGGASGTLSQWIIYARRRRSR